VTAHASFDDGFDVVVSADGTLTVPAAELARRGVHPGASVRLVPSQRKSRGGRHAGALADTVPPIAVDELVAGLDEARAERAAQYGEPAVEA
jgi:hypothetical protein